ncbi:MAG: hypothetical protein A2X46_15895 [Lentisphaerae bacterium GWF2_57_35]|nr:MAG: hypothetical protein A2X46_15895 [Lentisphaerae bacterium GWF2_57_35]
MKKPARNIKISRRASWNKEAWKLILTLCIASASTTFANPPDMTGICIQDGNLYLAADTTNSFVVERKTPDSDWETLGIFTPPPEGDMEWFRAISSLSTLPKTQSDAIVFDPASPTLPSETDSSGALDGWTLIGRYYEDAGTVIYGPVVEMKSAADAPTTAGNNHAVATPDPGRVKMFWYNTSSRMVAAWMLSATGTLKSSGTSNSGGMSAGWVLKGAGDINRDGIDDIIWHNSSTRMVAYWIMAADGYLQSSGLANDGAMAAGWELKGVGDINRDGTIDILWHNSSTRMVAYWLLNQNGTLNSSGFCTSNTMSAGWVLKGVGDIDRDGTVDVLWHNSSTRMVAYWLLNQNGTLNSSGLCNPSGMSAGWEFRAAGDIDNDGTIDVFWHNASTKRVAFWTLNADGTLKASGFCFDGTMSGGWVLEAAGDINNDGTSDLLWYNSSTCRVAYWLLNSSGAMTSSGFCTDSAMSSGWALEASAL